MLSVIICSRSETLFSKVSLSIKDTIGVDYELIRIDNSNGDYSICQAYNIGADKSKYNILCFMHEDLIFKTKNWGNLVINYFNDLTIGLIGVAGSKYKSKSNSPWWGVLGKMENYHNLRYIQSDSTGNKVEYCYLNSAQEVISDVVTLDGFWLCTRKNTWDKNRFDEINLKGFHFYDLDISLQIKKTLRVCVIYDILIEHTSYGSINRSWVENSMVFHNKWKKSLPLFTINLPPNKIKYLELLIAKDFLRILKDFGFNSFVIFKYYTQYLRIYSFRDYFWLIKNSLKN